MGEIATAEDRALQSEGGSREVTPMQMLSMAVQQGADPQKLQQLMDLHERWEANQARKAFVAAMKAFKADPPRINKNKRVRYQNKDGSWTDYDQATLDHVCDEIIAALARHGISHRWDVEQTDKGVVRVTCILTHEQGHSERVSIQSGVDPSGGKNSIQAIGSAVTYLERYTLLAATGMAAKGQDDDGREADPEGKDQGGGEGRTEPRKLTESQVSRLVDLMDETRTPEQRLLRHAFAGRPPQGATVRDIPATMFDRCVRKLTATLNQQRRAAREGTTDGNH